MFSSTLKRPALALAVTAGLLAVAGPASAGTTDEPKEKGTGFTVPSEAVNFWLGSNDALTAAVVAADFNYKEATQAGHSRAPVTSPTAPELDANPNASSSGDAYINEMGIKAKGDVVAGPTGLKFDSNEWAEDLGFTALPEMDANANASMPEVDDEVLAGVNYEPDVFW
jgi:hypothetical protein